MGVLHVLSVPVWILPGYFGFIPHFNDMNVRLTGDIKLALGVNVSINCGISPVMDW